MKTLPATSLYLVALTGAALWLSACGSVIDPDEDGGSAVEPDDHNGTLLPLEDRVADGVRSAAQQFIDDGDIAGMSVMVMQPDSGDIYREHFGLADIEAKTPMADDTLFRLASMTKPIVSAAVMMLVEDGELALDDPIATYLPEWAEIAVLTADDLSDPDSPYTTAPAAGDITVHQLLTHTSGITYAFYGGLMGRLYRDAGITDGFEHSFYTTDIQSETLAGIPLAFEPGTAYSYGLSIDILGRLIEAVSGQNLEDFLRQRLFEPLGMEDTHFRLPPAKLERLAPLYRKEDGSSIERVLADGLTNYEGGPRLPAALYAADFAYNGFRTYLSGGAGLISTTDDYVRFLTMIYNGGEHEGTRLLEAETVAMMGVNQLGEITTGQGYSFGYGFAVQDLDDRHPQFGPRSTYFWAGIFNTWFWIDPADEVIALSMAQLWRPNAEFQQTMGAAIFDGLAGTGDSSP